MRSPISTKKDNYKLREVIPFDIDILFEWVNEFEVRKSAIDTHQITFEEHASWFNKKIKSTACKMFILEIENEPAGQVRFEFNDEDNVWEIDYSISRKFRGLGLGRLLVKEGINSLKKFPIAAYVKEENTRSQFIFNALNFTNLGLHKVKNTKLLKYIKVLPDG